MKNITSNVKERLISRYLEKSDTKVKSKSTDINILLNRVKLKQKMSLEKKSTFLL